ncbi:unnamed protein product [Phytophthora fragariaefolia]|uniref:Unnamed protein product n=1 Tax=Phytophthora fragariaefolia TaxID=1490495 RepID=A0A9W6TWW5_9STRA|nr:unnamed protein product [Phytophthora fragariaefolia]
MRTERRCLIIRNRHESDHYDFNIRPQPGLDYHARSDYRDSPQGRGGYQDQRFDLRAMDATRLSRHDNDASPRQRDDWDASSRHDEWYARIKFQHNQFSRDRDNLQWRDSDMLQHTISELMAGATRFRPPEAELQFIKLPMLDHDQMVRSTNLTFNHFGTCPCWTAFRKSSTARISGTDITLCCRVTDPWHTVPVSRYPNRLTRTGPIRPHVD